MNSVDVDVRIEHVSKEYKVGASRRAPTFCALNDVTLEVARGSSVGIIGRNGAGKSTLLKLLAGVTAPTRGRIVVEGRLVALIEIGSGFHPELTGRENVFLSGAIMGMRRAEIAAKLSRIIEFAGVEKFIDTPVKWYSSGMYVRLGFAIAAHLEPDILLVDEVLAVGDAEFQARCLARIQELQRQGVTLIFISHDLTAVRRLCDTAVLLDRGAVAGVGPPSDVVSQYHRSLTTAEIVRGDFGPLAREGVVKVEHVTFSDDLRQDAVAFATGRPLTVSIAYAAARPITGLAFELTYYSSDGKTIVASAHTDGPVDVHPPGGTIEFRCESLALNRGAYYVGAVVRELATLQVVDWWDGGTMLYVGPLIENGEHGFMPHTWRHVRATGAALRASVIGVD
jgi:lipopolysaccharide transport system ATP-binding protein